MMSEFVEKFRREGPHGLAYEELLILVLGDESEEDVETLIGTKSWSETKELLKAGRKKLLLTKEIQSLPGIRDSFLIRLIAMKALAVALGYMD